VDSAELKKEITLHPENYTYWFRLIMNHPELAILA
jgi:hypothetical protein